MYLCCLQKNREILIIRTFWWWLHRLMVNLNRGKPMETIVKKWFITAVLKKGFCNFNEFPWKTCGRIRVLSAGNGKMLMQLELLGANHIFTRCTFQKLECSIHLNIIFEFEKGTYVLIFSLRFWFPSLMDVPLQQNFDQMNLKW